MWPFSRRDLDYTVLPQDSRQLAEKDIERSSTDSAGDIDPSSQLKDRSRTSISLVISGILIVLLSALNLLQWRQSHHGFNKENVYSPAAFAVKYKTVVTNAGLVMDKSPYQGPPSNETDQRWKDLYNFGLTRIDMNEASQLVNRTVPIPEEPGNYMVTLNVFHHLHCLNMIRKRVWLTETDNAPQYGPMGIIHMDHCIDGIRQALMCASDITPRPYGWDPLGKNVVAVNHVARTCRDFDAIREWALPRQVHSFSYSMHIDDPLGNVYIEEALQKAWPNGTRPENI